jgi:AcrR family transcriptional regulator
VVLATCTKGKRRPISDTRADDISSDQPRWLAHEREDEQPVRQPLSRRRIVDAALALVEEHGLAGLTMRRVASELAVTPMSLYNHVSDKAELIDLMVDLILGDVVADPLDEEIAWQEQMRRVAWAMFRVWSAHPGFARVYCEGVTAGPNGLATIERVLRILRQAGFADEDAAHGFFLLWHYTMASLLVAPTRPVSLHARSRRSDGTARGRQELYFSALAPTDIPNLIAVGDYMSGSDFDFGLNMVLAGLEQRRTTHSRPLAP